MGQYNVGKMSAKIYVYVTHCGEKDVRAFHFK